MIFRKLFKDIFSMDQEAEPKQDQDEAYPDEFENMKALEWAWYDAKPLEGFPYNSRELEKFMVREIMKDYRNFEFVPPEITLTRDGKGRRFYRLLDESINRSLLRLQVEEALSTPVEEASDLDVATMKLYAYISKLDKDEDVAEYFYGHDEFYLGKKRIDDLVGALGETILYDEAALRELAHIVINYPETFLLLPDEVQNYTEKDSAFYDTLVRGEEMFAALAIQAKNGFMWNRELSPAVRGGGLANQGIRDYLNKIAVALGQSLEDKGGRD